MTRFFLSLFFSLSLVCPLFSDSHFTCCSRTPKYIIMTSTLFGAGAGALAGFVAGTGCCKEHHRKRNFCCDDCAKKGCHPSFYGGFGNCHDGCHHDKGNCHDGCHEDCHGCDQKKHFCISEIFNSLVLIPPSDHSGSGPLIQVSIFAPNQQLFQQVIMGQNNPIPHLCNLGGACNPTLVGKWTVSFTIISDCTSPSDFGGICVCDIPFVTALSTLPHIGEQQQVVFCYPIQY